MVRTKDLFIFMSKSLLTEEIVSLTEKNENKSPKFQKISEFQMQIFLFSFEPKNERNHFLNSALVSKMSQIKKINAFY